MCYDNLCWMCYNLSEELKFMLSKVIEEENSIMQSEVLSKKFVSSWKSYGVKKK